jgi:predicted nucleotidyltransferase
MTAENQRHVDPIMAERIRSELSAIEREHGVKIVLAVESGSRAWGFPSQDSDYDVRFIYLRPVEDYLTVVPRRDVIERPVDAVLDVNGWDIRKAIALMLKSNAVLQEWLSSPVRYIEVEPVSRQLKDFLEKVADTRAFEYHYDHQAQRSFAEVCATGNEVRMKSYCYALRASLALRWLRDRGTPPPMGLPSLMAGVDHPPELGQEIVRLVDRKACGGERDTIDRISNLDTFIQRTLEQPVNTPGGSEQHDITARADALFASIVLRSLTSPNCQTPPIA